MISYEYAARVVRVVDGDTFDADLSLGFYLTSRQRFRLFGYNAPELRGVERPIGILAFNKLVGLIGERDISLVSYKGDSFGRWLCSVQIDGLDLVSLLIATGWGVPWDGRGTRPKFDPSAPYPLPPSPES
jgi:endonuclease YncB( thermonuclease family)